MASSMDGFSVNGTDRASQHDNILQAVQNLNVNAEAFRDGDQKARDALVSDCFRLVAALETPSETFMRILWTNSIHPPVIRLASDMKVFDILKDAEGTPMNTDEIAEAAGADPRLINRVMRTLASFYVVGEVDVDKFAATRLSDSLADPTYKSALGLMIPYGSNANLRTSEYFKERKYQWPKDPLDCPVQFATGDSGTMSFFEMMKRDNQFVGLESLMKVWLNGRPHWSDEAVGFYPVADRLLKGADTGADAAFLVDVAGGHGQDFLRLFANVLMENIPGRLVLQDLQHVIEAVPEGSLPDRVEKMVYDFYTEQPIKGARVYFMHNIIHNHPDDQSKKILKQVAAAMKKGYSKLLLWDTVMPDRGAGANVCCLDWEMLTFYGSSERTESEWRKLLEDPEIGLKVVDIVHYSRYDQDVIELELA